MYKELNMLNFSILVNGRWGEWSSWSDCSVSCGIGERSATRSCDNPPPINGGLHCSADGSMNEKTRQCLNPPCASKSSFLLV